MRNEAEEKSKIQKMIDTATPADRDTEAMLQELDYLASLRRPDPRIEARYAELRETLAKRLKEEGPRYFMGADGVKRYSYSVYPDKAIVNESVLETLRDTGVITDEQYERAMPRKPDTTAIKRLITRRGLLTNAQRASLVDFVEGTPRIYQTDESGETEDE